MSNSKESTIFSQFSLSSLIIDDSALLSHLIKSDSCQNTRKNPEILFSASEFDLIIEDRQRLRIENEKLKLALNELKKKSVEIEFLTKVATRALEENQELKKKLEKTSQKSKWENFSSPFDGLLRRNSVNLSPSDRFFLISRAEKGASPVRAKDNRKVGETRRVLSKILKFSNIILDKVEILDFKNIVFEMPN